MGGAANESGGPPLPVAVQYGLAQEVMGHAGRKQRGGKHYAEFTSAEGHIYRMPYEEWVEHEQPTIVTVTVQAGVVAGSGA